MFFNVNFDHLRCVDIYHQLIITQLIVFPYEINLSTESLEHIINRFNLHHG